MAYLAQRGDQGVMLQTLYTLLEHQRSSTRDIYSRMQHHRVTGTLRFREECSANLLIINLF